MLCRILRFIAASLTVSIAGAGWAPARAQTTAPAGSLTPASANALLGQIAGELADLTALSRPILLGKRNPSGASCVKPNETSRITALAQLLPSGDKAGGIGLRFSALFYGEVYNSSPRTNFDWHQSWLRLGLESTLAANKEAAAKAAKLTDKAQRLFAGLEAWSDWQEGFAPCRAERDGDWPSYCLKSLDRAVASRDLPQARRWAGEFASASLALADLHRWLAYLLENHLASLAFQARCESLLNWAEQAVQDGTYDLADFPAGVAGVNTIFNYLEAERQAEWLYRLPQEYLDLANGPPADCPAAIWMSPEVRRPFLEVRARLNPASQVVWDRAARSPYERSYLVNMLFRTSQAGAIDKMIAVLKRMEATGQEVSVPDVMDVIFYRCTDGFSAARWDDRYHSRLMELAEKLTGDNERVLKAARKITNEMWGGWQNYEPASTIHEALERNKWGCVRATDITNVLARNAGLSGFYVVRWCCGKGTHVLPATDLAKGGKRRIRIADPLETDPARTVETWPSAYFRGHPWPTEYPLARPDIYAVELYARGLDNYVWMEGYIVRGPNAGLLVRAGVPYLPGQDKPSSEKVFAGPYPPEPRLP